MWLTKKTGKSATADFPAMVYVDVLEVQLDSQLHVELFARTKARGAVKVADGVGHCAEARTAMMSDGVFIAAEADRTDARRKVRAIEHVEHVRAQLKPESFRHMNVLDDGEIHVFEVRSRELVSRDGSATASCIARIAEGRWV